MKTSHLAFAIVAAFIGAAPVSAQTVGLHLASVHVPAREGQRNFNPGIYIRFDNGVTAGTYANTLGKQTVYAGWTYEFDYVSVTLGVATGYQRTVTTTPQSCSADQMYAGLTSCWSEHKSHGVKTLLTPMLAPSVRLPAVFGVTPRISFMPGLAGSSNVFHLSVEHSF